MNDRDGEMSAKAAELVAPSAAQRRHLPEGSRFGRYSIGRLVGIGGMAEVYEAEHLGLRKRVAIKVMSPTFAENSTLRMRFLREGEAAARIQHPNVVDITDVGLERNIPYLVMEFLDGATLEEHFRRKCRLEVEEAATLMVPVAAALTAAHEAGVIHRDLKPENIVLAEQGRRVRPKVLDFGVSRLVTSPGRATLEQSVLGTPHYMSPEQARGEPVDESTDQYSLAVLLYELTTARLPRDRPSLLELLQAVGHEDFPPPRALRPDLPVEFEEVILRAMRPTPAERFPSMRDFGLALLPFLSGRAREYWHGELVREGHPHWPPTSGVHRAMRSSTASRIVSSPDHETLAEEDGLAVDVSLSTSEPPPALITTGARTGSSGPPLSEPASVMPAKEKERRPWVVIAGLGAAAAMLAIVLVAWVLAAPADHAVDAQASVAESPAALSAAELLPSDLPAVLPLSITAEPAAAEIVLDGHLIGRGAVQADVTSHESHELVVRAEGYESHRIVFQGAVPTEHVELELLAAAPSDEAGADEAALDDVASSDGAGTVARAAVPARATRSQIRRGTPIQRTLSGSTPMDAPRADADPPREGGTSSTPTVLTSERLWPNQASRTDNIDPWSP
jgi:serine/threonine protein kinase